MLHLPQSLLHYLPLKTLSLISSIVGASVVMAWRVQEGRTPVTARKILIPPLGMATGFCMFVVPMFRVPWLWAIGAFLAGALLLAWPMVRLSKLERVGDQIMARRSHAFLAVVIVLAGIRVAARGYLDNVLSVQQTAGLFFILAFGMIVRWRVNMFRQYLALTSGETADADGKQATGA
jgi:membrane protein CcdC involved in cytochrome C biogenesis